MTVSTAILLRRDKTSSHSASRLDSSLGNGISTGNRDKGGGLTKGTVYPCLIIARTHLSEVICCQAGRKNDSLPPTGKRLFCAISSCVSHTRPGISRKVDPSTHPLQNGWDRWERWGWAINGVRLEASCWRPPAPWHPAEPEAEQGARVPDLLLAPLFFYQRLLAAEPPSPEGTEWAVGGGGTGGAALHFWDYWAAPVVPWATLEPDEANLLTWVNFSWLRIASLTEDWNCPPKNKEPTKGVDKRVALRGRQSQNVEASRIMRHWAAMATDAAWEEVMRDSRMAPCRWLHTALWTGSAWQWLYR